MDIRQCTRTKGGYEVKIWEVINGCPYGRIFLSKIMTIIKWDASGEVAWSSAPLPAWGNFNLDLTDWRDEIPWECIRDEVNWVTWDKHKDWVAWAKEPLDGNHAWTSVSIGKSYFLGGAIKMPTPPADWREAIARRPER